MTRDNRGKVAGEILVKSAFEELNHWSRSWFSSKGGQDELRRKKQEKLGEILVDGLSRLKGSGLKILQNLSLDEELIPAPMLKKLEKSFSQTKPMNPFIVKKVFKGEFGRAPEALYSEFEEKAMAAASIGQVHRATLTSGIPVAVKIQYPHVGQDLKNELQLLKKMVNYVENPLVRGSISTVADQILNEIDYTSEATHCQWYYKNMTSEKFAFPRVFPELSGKTIITFEYFSGPSTLEIMQKDQRVPAETCQQIFDFFFESLFKHHTLHGDPHPGNFIQLADGRLGILDFGLVESNIDPDIIHLFRHLLLPEENDDQPIIDLYKKMGATIEAGGEKEFLEKVVRPFQEQSREIMNQEQFDFHKGAKALRKMRSAVLSQSFNPSLRDFSKNSTLVHRSIQNLFLMLSRFRAEINTSV